MDPGTWWNGGFTEGRQGDLLAEPFELADEAADVRVGGVAPEQELGTELGIGLAPVEHVVHEAAVGGPAGELVAA